MTWGTLYTVKRCRDQRHLAENPPPLRAKVWKEAEERRARDNICDDESLLKACPRILAPGWTLGNCRDGEPMTYNGYHSVFGQCERCRHEANREYEAMLKERQKKEKKRYYQRNAEARREYSRKYEANKRAEKRGQKAK